MDRTGLLSMGLGTKTFDVNSFHHHDNRVAGESRNTHMQQTRHIGRIRRICGEYWILGLKWGTLLDGGEFILSPAGLDLCCLPTVKEETIICVELQAILCGLQI